MDDKKWRELRVASPPKSPSPMLRVADDSLGTLSAAAPRATSPRGPSREALVRMFVRYLLKSLFSLHARGTVHLDLRPETILLRDGRLILADFGQSRKLNEDGLITGECTGSPEFVSPEMVRGLPLTPATDLWSLGTLTYVLLTGISPFHGDSDSETLWNVAQGNYVLLDEEWADFSPDAQHFVEELLQKNPRNRLSAADALSHPWLYLHKDEAEVPLSIDCLREFKYHNSEKWLDRRVFVLQTPSDTKEAPLTNPSAVIAQPRRLPAEQRGMSNIIEGKKNGDKPPPPPLEPEGDQQKKDNEVIRVPLDDFGRLIRLEDLLRIPHDDWGRPKERDNGPPVDFSGNPLPKLNKNLLRNIPPEIIEKLQRRHPGPPQDWEKRHLLPQQKGENPAQAKRSPPPPSRTMDPDLSQVPMRMIRGERRDIEEEIANRILSDISEENSIAGSLASIEDLLEYDDRPSPKLPPLVEHSSSPSGAPGPGRRDDRSSASRSRSSTPQASGASTPTLTMLNNDKANGGDAWPATSPIPPDIVTSAPEEEMRIEGFSPPPPPPASQLSAPLVEEDLRPSAASPQPAIVTTDENGLPREEYPYNMPVLAAAEADPSIPVGAPLFVEGLNDKTLVVDTFHTKGMMRISQSLSPASPRNRSRAGTKSPVIYSPGKEHSMEVVIATKRGKPNFIPPDGTAPEIDDEDANYKDRETKAKSSAHDPEFKDDSDKREKRKAPADDLERYRPKHFYKDPHDDQMPEYDIDDSPWDSHYQIGPDTYLMASRGPQFNARVRDYRRMIWGDGASIVTQGYLGARNADVSVRERRRYTDILREKASGEEASTVNDAATSIYRAPSASAIERIKADIAKVSPSATKRNEDGTFAPIFSQRLRDVPFLKGAQNAVFECKVVGSPAPKITWSMHDTPFSPDERHVQSFVDGVARLMIVRPQPADLGQYACEARNEYGFDKTSARLISGDAPARPGRPDVELSSDTELFMTWDAPVGPTYLEGITYKLEYRPQNDGDPCAPWHTISDVVDDEAVVVKHLEPMGIYQFRVRARNSFGYGEPSLTSRIVRTHGRGAPKLQIDILKTEKRLSVVSMPQVKQGKALEGISEESEESEAEVEKDRAWVAAGEISLSSEDPRSRFQLESLISKGRFSFIRNAVDNKTEVGSHCSCKVSESTEEARREHLLLVRGQHENIVHLLAAHSHNGLLYLFTERLFEDVFARFTFIDNYTEEQIAITIRQIAAGLHWLHFKGIVHLSLSPHNIMFTTKRSWIVRIVDMSEARLLEDKPANPKSFDQNWAPPEFYVEGAQTASVQSDVWGMGVIAFCLLGGFHPFTSEYDTYDEIKENVIKVKCDPNLIPVQASQEALSFVTWALKKSVLRRIRTDEALSHRFLSTDPSIVRRREAIKYPSTRLRKTAYQTRKQIKVDAISDKLKAAASQ